MTAAGSADPANTARTVPGVGPVWVVVVTHSVPAAMLDRCVRSVVDAGGADRVVVVDNGAGTPLAVADVEVIRSPNRGFGAAANVALFRAIDAGAAHVMVLNDDVEVEPGWLAPLREALDTDPGLGAAQPLLLLAGSDPARVNSAGVTIGRDGAGTDIGFGEVDGPAFARATDIAAFTAGAVLLRSAFVDDVGGFDERYGMYYEDVDLAARGRELGWRYRLVPESRVWHARAATTSAGDRSDRITYLQERNRLWAAVRFASPATVVRAHWLSVRRLRHHPRRVHLRSLGAGVRAWPRLLLERAAAGRAGRGSRRPSGRTGTGASR